MLLGKLSEPVADIAHAHMLQLVMLKLIWSKKGRLYRNRNVAIRTDFSYICSLNLPVRPIKNNY